MNFQIAVDRYVEEKRRQGIAFQDGEAWLQRFALGRPMTSLSELSTLDIADFLDTCGTSSKAWQIKLRFLTRFFDYWESRRMMGPLLMPPSRQAQRGTFSPYVYTEDQVRALLAAAVECQEFDICALEHTTLRMIVQVRSYAREDADRAVESIGEGSS